MKYNNVIVIVPTLNNDTTIQNVVNDILEHQYKVILVDDGYTNKLENILQDNDDVIILRHAKNQGKGASIITGAKKAKELGYEYFVIMDGDGQHLASQIVKMTKACNGKDQIIIGARNFNINDVPNASKFGRWFSNFWAKWDTEQNIEDSLSGFRLYPISILDLKIKTYRFDWEMEVLVKHSWKKRIIKEVTIECFYPKAEDRVSHFKKFRDTASIVKVHLRLLPFKLFFLSKFK
ncbi:MAG: glycosyltransferase family 2 protein [Campylobacterales bacterium]|nr:glycosyltransferase family 2 protein [Campylobacterales bacterium]